jgi:hypothetical protein
MFIASAYWRGSMNVGQLRTFPTEQKAIDYVKKLPGMYIRGEFLSGAARVYEVFSDRAPRLVKIK